MRFDCNLYVRGIESAKYLYERNKIDHKKAVGVVAMGCSAPLMASCQYALQFIWPDCPELLHMKDNLTKFYHYTEIVPFK